MADLGIGLLRKYTNYQIKIINVRDYTVYTVTQFIDTCTVFNNQEWYFLTSSFPFYFSDIPKETS